MNSNTSCWIARGWALVWNAFVSSVALIAIGYEVQSAIFVGVIIGAILITTFVFSYRMYDLPLTYWRVVKYTCLSCLLTIAFSAGFFILVMGLVSKDGFIIGLFFSFLVVMMFILVLLIPSLLYTWAMGSLSYFFYRIIHKVRMPLKGV